MKSFLKVCDSTDNKWSAISEVPARFADYMKGGKAGIASILEIFEEVRFMVLEDYLQYRNGEAQAFKDTKFCVIKLDYHKSGDLQRTDRYKVWTSLSVEHVPVMKFHQEMLGGDDLSTCCSSADMEIALVGPDGKLQMNWKDDEYERLCSYLKNDIQH